MVGILSTIWKKEEQNRKNHLAFPVVLYSKCSSLCALHTTAYILLHCELFELLTIKNVRISVRQLGRMTCACLTSILSWINGNKICAWIRSTRDNVATAELTFMLAKYISKWKTHTHTTQEKWSKTRQYDVIQFYSTELILKRILKYHERDWQCAKHHLTPTHTRSVKCDKI